jgi:hypothetical protein
VILFRRTAPGTNTAVQLLGDGGLRVFETLRSADAPHNFSFPFQLPAGFHLSLATRGRVEIRRPGGEKPIYGIVAPWGIDRTGLRVDVRYSLSGRNTLVLHIGDASHYPVIVDPGIIDVGIDVGAWALTHVLRELNTHVNLDPVLCKITGETGCKETAYAPSDQQAQQLGLMPTNTPSGQSGTGLQTLTPDGSALAAPVYECPNDSSNIGIYVPPGHYWHNDFVANGTSIIGGSIGLGANDDDLNHEAEVGVYEDPGLTRPLRTSVVSVAGYQGVHFSFAEPLATTPGATLYLGARGIGGVTVYDNRVGCMIGTLESIP